VIFLISRRSGSKPIRLRDSRLLVLPVTVGLFASDAAVATWVQPVSNFAETGVQPPSWRSPLGRGDVIHQSRSESRFPWTGPKAPWPN